MNQFKQHKKGQAIAEYLILTALIAIGSIAILQIVGKNLKVALAKVSDALQGRPSTVRNGTRATDEHIKIRDLSDFTEGIQDNEDNSQRDNRGSNNTRNSDEI